MEWSFLWEMPFRKKTSFQKLSLKFFIPWIRTTSADSNIENAILFKRLVYFDLQKFHRLGFHFYL